MSDPYREAFARDHLSSSDFAMMYGLDRPVNLRLFQFGLKDAKDPSNWSKPAVPKPVVWFVEHQDRPMYVNRTQHENLMFRFGDGYWEPANRDGILHAPIQIKVRSKAIKDDVIHIVEFVDKGYFAQWATMKPDIFDRFMAACENDQLEFKRDRFRTFVSHHYPELLGTLDSTEKLPELPNAFMFVLNEFRQEMKGDLSNSIEPEPAPEPRSEPDASDIPF